MIDKSLRVIALLITLLIATACDDKELMSSLSERDAMEIAVLLHRKGILVDKTEVARGRRKQISLRVSETDYANALAVLHEFGFPREKSISLENVLEQKGMVPLSQEISEFSLDHALSLDLERLLSDFTGVIEAKAIVRSNLVGDDELGILNRKPTAAIVVRYELKNNALPFSVEELKQTATKTVAGLELKDVKVVLSPISTISATPTGALSSL